MCGAVCLCVSNPVSCVCAKEHACRVAVRVLSTKLTFIASAGSGGGAQAQALQRAVARHVTAAAERGSARETAPAARRTARGSRGPRRAPRGGRLSPRLGAAGSRPPPCDTTRCPTEMPSTTSYSERSAVSSTSSRRRSSRS